MTETQQACVWYLMFQLEDMQSDKPAMHYMNAQQNNK